MSNHDYIPADAVTVLRIFHEPTSNGIQWSLDGTGSPIEGYDGYTEACWSYDTLEDLLPNVRPFAEQHAPLLLTGIDGRVARTEQARTYDWADVARAIVGAGVVPEDEVPGDLFTKVAEARLCSASSRSTVALLVALLASSVDAELSDAIGIIRAHDESAWQAMGYVMKASTLDFDHEDFRPGGAHATEPAASRFIVHYNPDSETEDDVDPWEVHVIDGRGVPACVTSFRSRATAEELAANPTPEMERLADEYEALGEQTRTVIGPVTADTGDYAFRISYDPVHGWAGSFQKAVTDLLTGDMLHDGPVMIQVDFQDGAGGVARATGRLVEVETGPVSSVLRFEDGHAIDVESTVAVGL